MPEEIFSPFIIDEFNLSDEELKKIEIAIVLINAELKRKKKEKLNFIGKLYYPFYFIPITKKFGMIIDALKLFSEKIRLKDIESIASMDPSSILGDPTSDMFIDKIKEFSKKVENLVKSRGEKINLEGLISPNFMDELIPFIIKASNTSEDIQKIDKKMNEDDALKLKEIFGKLFELKMGQFIEYELKMVHAINLALKNLYNTCSSIIDNYDSKINSLDDFINLINNSFSVDEIQKYQSEFDKKYSEMDKVKVEKLKDLDKKEDILLNAKSRIHESYNILIKYVIDIQKEVEEYGIEITDDMPLNSESITLFYLPIYIVEFLDKKPRFQYIVPIHLFEKKKSTQISEHSKNFKEFEHIIEKNYNNNLFHGVSKSDILNILEEEDLFNIYNEGIHFIGGKKWLDSGIYVKCMDFYNSFFRRND